MRYVDVGLDVHVAHVEHLLYQLLAQERVLRLQRLVGVSAEAPLIRMKILKAARWRHLVRSHKVEMVTHAAVDCVSASIHHGLMRESVVYRPILIVRLHRLEGTNMTV